MNPQSILRFSNSPSVPLVVQNKMHFTSSSFSTRTLGTFQPTFHFDQELKCQNDLQIEGYQRISQQHNLDRLHTARYDLSWRKPTQITMIYNTPSLEALIEEIRTKCCEETADHRKKTTSEFNRCQCQMI